MFVYLVKSFIVWNFTNPFRWIIDIPEYTCSTRALILFYVLFYQVFQFALILNFIPKQK